MERIPEVDAGGVNSRGPTQTKNCTPQFSKQYVVCVQHPAPLLRRACNRLCCLGLLFFLFWALYAIVGAIHFAIWYPRFDLKDIHIRNFDVTSERELNYDMDIVIEARHFSTIRRIEDHSYEVSIAHNGTVFGINHIPPFHPNNRTMTFSSTQHVNRLPLNDRLGDLVSADLNSTGRLALRVYMEGKISTALFLGRKKKKRGVSCDLILSPTSPLGLQIIDRKCLKKIPCVNGTTITGSVKTFVCKQHSPSCCAVAPTDVRSTERVCK